MTIISSPSCSRARRRACERISIGDKPAESFTWIFALDNRLTALVILSALLIIPYTIQLQSLGRAPNLSEMQKDPVFLKGGRIQIIPLTSLTNSISYRLKLPLTQDGTPIISIFSNKNRDIVECVQILIFILCAGLILLGYSKVPSGVVSLLG